MDHTRVRFIRTLIFNRGGRRGQVSISGLLSFGKGNGAWASCSLAAILLPPGLTLTVLVGLHGLSSLFLRSEGLGEPKSFLNTKAYARTLERMSRRGEMGLWCSTDPRTEEPAPCAMGKVYEFRGLASYHGVSYLPPCCSPAPWKLDVHEKQATSLQEESTWSPPSLPWSQSRPQGT